MLMTYKIILLILILISFVNTIIKTESDAHNEVIPLPEERKHGKYSFTTVLEKNVIFKLRGHRTTGYQWFVDNTPLLNYENILKPMNLNDDFDTSDYFTDKHEEGEVGVGGYYYFKFRPQKIGSTHIIFVNKRAWDESDKVIAEVDVTVIGSEKDSL